MRTPLDRLNFSEDVEGYRHMYQVALIPPEQWIPNFLAFRKGERPDMYSIYEHLRKDHNINVVFIDPLSFPFNPLARMHPMYGGLDPIRTINVLLKARSFDAVVSVFESSPTLLLILRSVFRFRLPIGMWDIAPDEKWWIRRIIQDIVVPKIDKVMVLSSAQVPYAEKRWNAGSKFSPIWQYVDTEFFTPVASNPTGPVLAIGDDHGRDWETFIEAVAPLDIDVILKTRKVLDFPKDAICRFNQIKHRISFSELRDLYAECSFVVIPLRQTLNVSGVGSILEAMAMGKAIIANNNLPILDYLAPNETADIVEVGDTVQLREAISKLVQNPDRARRMGATARIRAEEQYSPSKFAERMAEQLKELIAGDSKNH